MPRNTTILFDRGLRQRWPEPLAREWHEAYPELFDDDDLRLALNQPAYHFCEWFAAIHLRARDNVQVLVEKYAYGNHHQKRHLLEATLPRGTIAFLRSFRQQFGVQPPDLLLLGPAAAQVSFAEVKGPGDQLSDAQQASHRFIETTLGVCVEVISVREANARR